MRNSQNYFGTLIAIPVKPTKSLPLTSENADGSEPNEHQLETSKRQQARSQAKSSADDKVQPVVKVSFPKLEQVLDVSTQDDKTDIPPHDEGKAKSTRKRSADSIPSGPRKKKPPQYHRQQIQAAMRSFPSKARIPQGKQPAVG